MNSQTTTQFRSADGLALVADVGGHLDAPVVVLMHGGGQTRHSWSGAMKALIARGYRVINFDARGHGESDWSDEKAYTLDDRVADLATVLENTDRPYALVGASMGGGTAIHAVATGLHPAAVILVDIVPQVEPEGVQRIRDFMLGNANGFANLDEAADAVASYNPERKRPSDPSGLMKNLRLRDDGRLYWHWDPYILDPTNPKQFHETMNKSAEIMGRDATLPVLVVRGLMSDVIGDEGIAAFRAQVPQLEVADVEQAGHMVAGDKNDAFNAAVLDFLARHMPAER